MKALIVAVLVLAVIFLGAIFAIPAVIAGGLNYMVMGFWGEGEAGEEFEDERERYEKIAEDINRELPEELKNYQVSWGLLAAFDTMENEEEDFPARVLAHEIKPELKEKKEYVHVEEIYKPVDDIYVAVKEREASISLDWGIDFHRWFARQLDEEGEAVFEETGTGLPPRQISAGAPPGEAHTLKVGYYRSPEDEKGVAVKAERFTGSHTCEVNLEAFPNYGSWEVLIPGEFRSSGKGELPSEYTIPGLSPGEYDLIKRLDGSEVNRTTVFVPDADITSKVGKDTWSEVPDEYFKLSSREETEKSHPKEVKDHRGVHTHHYEEITYASFKNKEGKGLVEQVVLKEDLAQTGITLEEDPSKLERAAKYIQGREDVSVQDVSLYSSMGRSIEKGTPLHQVISSEQGRLEGIEGGHDITVDGNMVWPTPSDYTEISSGYGDRIHPVYGVPDFHAGIDISAPEGVPLYAVTDSKVIATGYQPDGAGYYVDLECGEYVYRYFHLRGNPYVRSGENLRTGDIIGEVGTSGTVTGAHLHFEVHKRQLFREAPVEESSLNPLNAYDSEKIGYYGDMGEDYLEE